MYKFRCPICKNELFRIGNIYKCENNHCFDIAKQGYVNLLISQKSSKKRHGDDTLMVNSRRDFLNKDFYKPLKDEIIKAINNHNTVENIVDLGCGECYYTDTFQRKFPDAEVCGIDISKQALIVGSKRNKNIALAVASTADLPIMDNSCDVVVSVFAPVDSDEIFRILKSDGIWVKAFPLEKHLLGLKNVIYDKPYLNEVKSDIPNGFIVSDSINICYNIKLTENSDIINLFRMTPYFYKTGIDDENKLSNCNFLETELEFGVNIYKKINI